MSSRIPLFTLAGSAGKSWEPIFGEVGNYDQMVGERVDAAVWNVIPIRYPGDDAISSIGVSVVDQLSIGIDNVIDALEAFPVGTKFAICGMSMGAEVASEVLKETRPGGRIADRSADLIAGVTFGNPERQAGHTIPGGIDPGGHGVRGPSARLTDTPALWWDFANGGAYKDFVTVTGDDEAGLLLTGIFDASYDLAGGLDEMLVALQTAFSDHSAATVQSYFQLFLDLIYFITPILNINDPRVNLNGHVRYHFTYEGLPNNTLSAVDLAVNYLNTLAYELVGLIPASTSAPPYTIPEFLPADRFRFIVEEARSGNILARDLVVQQPKVLRALSGACNIQFDINYRDYANAGIYFKPWGHWIHVEKRIGGVRKIWASGLVAPSQIDKTTGIMHLEAIGFAGYPKDLPALFNWNPLVIDPFEVVAKMWNHVQSYNNGNLGVEVYPATSGLEMLPGYAFDGNILNLDFFAVFIRAEDKQMCQDWIDKLARDIPFDYVEQSDWNPGRLSISKKIYLGYPYAGAQQDNLSFVINENVIDAEPHIETQTDWASDVIIDGWAPGTEYSSQLTNADPLRYRRVVMQDDARINSDERAAAWARRKLTRRQTPAYWESIIVDMDHPNAPFGSYDVGDRIWVKGPMPWVGDVNQLHKVIAIAVDEEKGNCQLTLKAEGAFEYDPIFYQGSSGAGSKTVVVPTIPTISVSSQPPTIG